jgi:hypothetical protein
MTIYTEERMCGDRRATNVAEEERMAVSQQEKDYHAERSRVLKAYNAEHGTKHKTLRDAGISLRGLGSQASGSPPKPKATPAKKRVRKSRAQAKQPTEAAK